MQFLPLYLIAIIGGCSLTISAPINGKMDGLQGSQHLELIASANHLLKDFVHEQSSTGKPHVRQENENVIYMPITHDVDKNTLHADVADGDGTSLGDGKDLMKFLEELRYFDEDSKSMVYRPTRNNEMLAGKSGRR